MCISAPIHVILTCGVDFWTQYLCKRFYYCGKENDCQVKQETKVNTSAFTALMHIVLPAGKDDCGQKWKEVQNSQCDGFNRFDATVISSSFRVNLTLVK